MTGRYPVIDTEWIYRGKVVSLRRDTLQLDDGSRAEREIVDHPGAVGVLAIDDQDRIVMVSQYRHAVAGRLDELPAGLLDVSDEPALAAARRELAEEASIHARDWDVLLDLHSSPGFSDEVVRIFLARGLTDEGRPEGFVVEGEEVDMVVSRVPIHQAVQRVFAGEITNASAVAGILAAALARTNGWAGLRPADVPWPGRPDS